MKAFQARSFKPEAHPLNANAWCEHHLSATHNSSDCNTYKKWISELKKGGFRKLEKGKDKVNMVEGTPDPPESANIANEHVFHSESAMQWIHAYLSSQSEDSGSNTLIIESGALSHIVPHHSWFLPFESQEQPHITRPLEMVYMDVGGPITPRSQEGYKFWIVIVDDFTCFPWVYFMKHKNEALQIYN